MSHQTASICKSNRVSLLVSFRSEQLSVHYFDFLLSLSDQDEDEDDDYVEEEEEEAGEGEYLKDHCRQHLALTLAFY